MIVDSTSRVFIDFTSPLFFASLESDSSLLKDENFPNAFKTSESFKLLKDQYRDQLYIAFSEHFTRKSEQLEFLKESF